MVPLLLGAAYITRAGVLEIGPATLTALHILVVVGAKMNEKIKIFLRTAQTNFPFLLDIKFALMRHYRNTRGVPFDRDFEGIGLFPDTEGALFLDVGANRGQSTDAILMMTKNSRVQLFEPNPLLCEKLQRQFAENSRIVINEFGLGNTTSERPLYVPFYKRWMFDGLASFDRDMASNWLQGRILFFRQEQVSLREVTCQLRQLDDLNLAPFFIKLDVQGYEFEAIRGGENTIKTHEPVLLIESPPRADMTRYLKNIGYEFYTFSKGRFIRGVANSNNTFFMTEKKSSLVLKYIASISSSSDIHWMR